MILITWYLLNRSFNALKPCKIIKLVAPGGKECERRRGLLTWPSLPLEPQQAPLCSRMRCCDTVVRFWEVKTVHIFPRPPPETCSYHFYFYFGGLCQFSLSSRILISAFTTSKLLLLNFHHFAAEQELFLFREQMAVHSGKMKRRD